LVLNLFIGIVTTEMADAKEEAAQRRKVEKKLALATRLRMHNADGKPRKRSERKASFPSVDGESTANPTFEEGDDSRGTFKSTDSSAVYDVENGSGSAKSARSKPPSERHRLPKVARPTNAQPTE
jgi:hypothetical protein